MRKLNYFKYLLWSLPLLPSIALAQNRIIPDPIGDLPGGTQSTISRVITDYIQAFLGIVGLVAVVFLIYGGFRYITSAGNDETAESAKKTIQNAIIGLIVIILSYIIVTVVSRAFIYEQI